MRNRPEQPKLKKVNDSKIKVTIQFSIELDFNKEFDNNLSSYSLQERTFTEYLLSDMLNSPGSYHWDKAKIISNDTIIPKEVEDAYQEYRNAVEERSKIIKAERTKQLKEELAALEEGLED